MSGASERANGRASGLVLTSRFSFVPDHSALVFDFLYYSDATTDLHKSSCPSAGPSVRPSARPSKDEYGCLCVDVELQMCLKWSSVVASNLSDRHAKKP